MCFIGVAKTWLIDVTMSIARNLAGAELVAVAPGFVRATLNSQSARANESRWRYKNFAGFVRTSAGEC